MERRDFIKTSIVAAGGLTGSSVNAAGEITGAPAVSTGEYGIIGANDRVRVGVIGCGGQANWDASDFAKQPDAQIVALCDVYDGSIKNTLANQTLKLDAEKTPKFKDFRRLLDDKGIDAVIIATPDHWHALPTIMACQAGKDVYVEKPLALSIVEGRRMVEAARKHNRVIQVGTQQRSARHFQKAVEVVQAGKLGRITRVHTWNYDDEYPKGIGNPPDSAPPEGLDWDFYLGPAPKVAFNQNRFLENFRWFWDYSGGKITDWGTHLIDIVHWAMKVDAPTAVSASGGKYFIADNRETPDTLLVTYEYPGFVMTYENRILNSRPQDGRWGYGIMFYGTDATMFVDRGGFEIFPEYDGKKRDDLFTARTAAARMSVQRGDPSHFQHVRNFLDCVKSRAHPISDVEIGHRSTAAPHLGNIALRTGRKIRWDGENEKIIGDAEASKWLSREYRAPWRLVEA
ncbi:MAG TPA: Gfo/Idh/MocA family oxidoreductase [Blastocatellia bacterium]|nr:Gfo/Idh/MocA family oxidoreductase [Blastocatellia bacterium]